MSVITYKQLQDSWIRSDWVDSNTDEFGEDEPVILPEFVSFGTVTVEDLLERNITTDNYFDIVRLADYIMVKNVDPIVDEIVKVTGNIDVVYEFEEFYRLSERLKPLDRNQLEIQVNEFTETNLEMFYKYGHSSFWDVSKVTDMGILFETSQFNGDISKWDVSNVENMKLLFSYSQFNGDISKWDVSNVTNMGGMFAKSLFNNDISKWNVSNVTNMRCMFSISQFNGDISKWDVSNVNDMKSMFYGSQFNGDISKWDVSNVNDMESMLYDSQFNGDISK